jgi:hypothetical protein
MRSSRLTVAACLAALAGCFDFGRFTLPSDGGAPDQAQDQSVPLVDMATPADGAGPPPDLAGCPIPDGNLLTGATSSFDNAQQGQWNGFNAVLTPVTAACVSGGLRMCHPDGGTGVTSLVEDFYFPASNVTYRTEVWVDPAQLGEARVKLELHVVATGMLKDFSNSLYNAGTGWQPLSATVPVPAPPDGGSFLLHTVLELTGGSSDPCIDVDQAWLGIM